jgi:superfamily II DNA or RNA helicase
VQVCGIQTLTARAMRGSSIEMPPADLLIIDEAHHVLANTWKDVADYYANAGAVILGMTATPARGDGRGLGSVFKVMVQGPTVVELIEGGYLVKTLVYAPYRPDLTGVRIVAGDYNESQVAERVNKPELVGDVVLNYLKHNPERRRTVVFAVNVGHATSICNAFCDAGIIAAVVHGGTPSDERRGILAKLERGEIDVVVNCMVLTEGWDQPSVSCLILARPTKSLALYRQMIGRVLRPAPGKANALIIDHAGATYEHGFAEDEIEWVLEEDRRARNKTRAARGAFKPRELLTCPECTALRTAGDPCPACGWRSSPKAREIEVLEGDLEKVEHTRTTKKGEYTAGMKQAWHQQLVWIGQNKGYKAGWASNKYREKFGVWPQRNFVTPLPATDEVARWVKSRNIAWVRGRAKAGQA